MNTIQTIDKKFHARLGQMLKEGREKSKLTQRQLAKKLGYTSPQYVSNWERGRVPPPLYVLPKVAKFTDLDSSTLVKLLVDHKREQFTEAFKHPRTMKPRMH
jgi:transcriptional regulator with XRE-family HTH domain